MRKRSTGRSTSGNKPEAKKMYQKFLSETNSQLANIMAYYSVMGKPFNYRDNVIEQIKKVTSEDILECANKYFTDDYVLAILKP